MTAHWWQDAVFYEVYVRSFADSDGDGVGDLEGIRQRLPHLRDLGVDALWLTPFFRSPMADHGYDVADPRDVDPLFGDLGAFDRLLADCHAHGMRLTVDVVPNHTSSQRAWFQAALAAAPGSPERARYLFRDGRGPDGAELPNDWPSVFGGPAWSRVAGGPDGADGQYYLHLFAPEQPDLDWTHPEVWTDLEQTLRFWLDRGVDGFRIDVAHSMAKPAGLPDAGRELLRDGAAVPGDPRFDDPAVHDVHRMVRRVLDSYGPDRMAVGECWLADPVAVARYVRPDELQLAFNFTLLQAPWDAAAIRTAIDESVAALAETGAPPTWVLSNHDVTRHVTRYGGGGTGTRRARAAALLLLALPGPVYLYQGEELGLEEVDVPEEARQDPIWERSGRTDPGRDGCRVPLPWSGDAPPFGFSPDSAEPWLPQPAAWAGRTVADQSVDDGSVLALYRAALRLRGGWRGTNLPPVRWLEAGPSVVAVQGLGDVVCAVNLGQDVLPLPAGRVLLTSEPGLTSLEPDTAVWLEPLPQPPGQAETSATTPVP